MSKLPLASLAHFLECVVLFCACLNFVFVVCVSLCLCFVCLCCGVFFFRPCVCVSDVVLRSFEFVWLCVFGRSFVGFFCLAYLHWMGDLCCLFVINPLKLSRERRLHPSFRRHCRVTAIYGRSGKKIRPEGVIGRIISGFSDKRTYLFQPPLVALW